MLDIYGIEANRRALLADLKQLIEEALQPFADDLREFLERVRAGQFGGDWRGAWDTFVETQAEAGFNIDAESASRLVQLMEGWERARMAGRAASASRPAQIAVAPGRAEDRTNARFMLESNRAQSKPAQFNESALSSSAIKEIGYNSSGPLREGAPAGQPLSARSEPINITRRLISKLRGKRIAAYSIKWDNFKLDKKALWDVVLIQKITVTGFSNVDGQLGPITYFEVLGTINKGKTNLGKTDLWSYPGDLQYPRGKPQITEERIVQTGQITAYANDKMLQDAISDWRRFLPMPIGNTYWSAGVYRSRSTFNDAHLTILAREKSPRILISTWDPKSKNKLTVDGN